MSFTIRSGESHPINKTLSAKQWFDYTPEMNAILNALHKRIFNLEIALQANNQILDRSHTMINDDLINHKTNTRIAQQQVLHRNSIKTSTRNSFILDQNPLNLTLENRLDKLNISPRVSFDQINPSNISLREGNSKHMPSSLPPLNLTPNQLKARAYEFAAIFENAFDELNIIYNTLSINDSNRNNNQSQLDDLDSNNCDPLALNRVGIITMNERDKLRYEIEYFFHILMLLFRTLLSESSINFQTSINDLPSKQLDELNNRLKNSQDKIRKLSFIKKHFQTEKSHQFNLLNSTKSQLKDHFMEEKSRSKIALRYCNDWKKNHILQWIQMLLQIEENYTKTIHQYANILKQTELAHQETIKILIKQNNELKFNVNKWYEYYQNETYRFERELTNFRHDFHQIKRQRYEMYEEYQRMNGIVEEYNQMKINEKLMLEKQKQQEEAAQRIQAWWRGTMVRHIKRKKKKK